MKPGVQNGPISEKDLRDAESTYIGDDDFVTLTKDGITIKFHIKNPAIDILNVFRAVKRAWKIVSDRFGYTLERIDVSIYSSKEEMRQERRSRSRYASWIAGIYDGEIRVICETDDEEPESLYVVLTHEIVHLAIDGICRGRCPDWLNEGLAIYLSQELDGDYQEVLLKAVKSGKTFPVEALRMNLFSDADTGIRQLAYAQAESTTRYIVDIYGWDQTACIVSQCRTMAIDAVLYGIGLNYTILEMGWELWIKKRAG